LLCTLLVYLYPCFCCVGERCRRGVVFIVLKDCLFCVFVNLGSRVLEAGIVLHFLKALARLSSLHSTTKYFQW
jgi:hypothetical protein